MYKFSFAEGGLSDGLIISGDVAHRLNVSPGDNVVLRTPFGKKEIKIAGILREFGSSEGYSLENLTDFNGVLLKVENGKVKQVEDALQKLSFVSSYVKKEETKDGRLRLMRLYMAMVYAMDAVMVTLAVIMIGIFGFITAKEQEWNFVILKAMGFSNREILQSSVLGILPLSIFGVSLGIPISVKITDFFNATFENPLTTPPAAFLPDVMIPRSVLLIVVSSLTVFFITRSNLKRNVAERLRQVFEAL